MLKKTKFKTTVLGKVKIRNLFYENSCLFRCLAQSAKRSISFPDSPTGLERAEKRPRLRLSCDSDSDMRPDSPGQLSADPSRPAHLHRAVQHRSMLPSGSGLHMGYSTGSVPPATASSSSSSFASPDHQILQGGGPSGQVIGPAAAAAPSSSSSSHGANGCGSTNSSGYYNMVTGGEVGVVVAASSSGRQQQAHNSNEATGSAPGTLSSSSSSSASAAIISGSSSYLIPLSIEVEDEVEGGGPDNNPEAGPSGQQQQHDSPSGSEVSEAGPSGQYQERRQQQHSAGQHHRRGSSCSPGSPTGGLVKGTCVATDTGLPSVVE